MTTGVAILRLLGQFQEEQRGEDWLQFATVDPAYVSGRPSLTFDGETQLSTITYAYLDSYAPTAGERVVVARVGSSKVILGGII